MRKNRYWNGFPVCLGSYFVQQCMSYFNYLKQNKRTMKLKSLFSLLLIAGATATIATGCKSKPKDADVKASVEAAVANPAVTVDVKECDVTLSGMVADDAAKSAAETSAKGVKDVKAVVNNIAVTPPPPPPAAVVVSPDAALIEAVNAAVAKFDGVKADVKDGVIMLSGEIKKADQRVLMPILQALKPKKVDNSKLTVKN